MNKNSGSALREIASGRRPATDWAKGITQQLLPKSHALGASLKRAPTLMELYDNKLLGDAVTSFGNPSAFAGSQNVRRLVSKANDVLTAKGLNSPKFLGSGLENTAVQLPNGTVMKIGVEPLQKHRSFDLPNIENGSSKHGIGWRIQPKVTPGTAANVLPGANPVNSRDMLKVIREGRKQGYVPHDISGYRFDQFAKDPKTGKVFLIDPNSMVRPSMKDATGIHGVLPSEQGDNFYRNKVREWRKKREAMGKPVARYSGPKSSPQSLRAGRIGRVFPGITPPAGTPKVKSTFNVIRDLIAKFGKKYSRLR